MLASILQASILQASILQASILQAGPRAAAAATTPRSALMARSMPMTCGLLPPPRACPSTFPSAATRAASVLLFPPSMARIAASPVLPGSLACCRWPAARYRPRARSPAAGPRQEGRVFRNQPVGQLVRQVVLPDQRVRQQRGGHPVPAAAQRRVESQLLIR